MAERSLSDATLVLLGHGSSQDPGAAAPIFQHAADLRKRGCFGDVLEAFWKQSPNIKELLPGLPNRLVFIVPLFMSEGYFSSNVIPQELGFLPDTGFPRLLRMSERLLVYCSPVGTHNSMSNILLARAEEVVNQHPFPRLPPSREITLVIAGHGTQRDPQSRNSVEHQAAVLHARGIYASVHALFLDEEPCIQECYKLAQTRNIVVVPFFVGSGPHTQRDIPVLLGESARLVEQRLSGGQFPWRNPTEKRGKLVWYSLPAGTHPRIAETILDIARESARRVESES